MFLTEKKLENRIAELKELRYRDVRPLGELAVKEDTQGVTNPEPPVCFEGWETMRAGQTWEGRDKYLWLHKDVMLPLEWKGKKAVGLFDFGNTGAGNNSGFEALLYVDGKPYQGVDANHQEVFFKDSCCGGRVNLTFRLWSGLEGGGVPKPQEHKLSRADVAWLDEKTDDLYYTGSMILDELLQLEESDPVKYALRSALDEACGLIDWSEPLDDEFYASVHEADDFLNEKLKGMEKHSRVNVKCVGHTHIDMAWLWRLKHTREKASRSFSTVLRLMEQYPEYIFLQTQPQLYRYVKEDFPELYERIREKIADGQWECDGAMWVEADCNLTSGESLTRQILLGSRFIKEEFGKDVEYLWLPDVFGYSWALPQILKKSGIDMFMTTKISWNQYNRMPHDTFQWKGMDGTEVLTHFITTPDPWSEPGSWFYTYNGKLTPKTVRGVWEAYSEKEMNQELLIAYGFGDGGGGVNRDMLEQRRRIDKLPGLPNLKTSTAGEYFRDLKETVRTTKRFVNTWDGELYLEYHRGTYTSHAYNKRMNRKMELLYREAEWLTAFKGVMEKDLSGAEQEKLTKGWEKILTNQFHDIIPGSSIREVYEDSRLDYEETRRIASEVLENAYAALLKEAPEEYTVVNASGFVRDGVAVLPEVKKGVFRDASGRRLLSQTGENATYIEVKEASAMGMTALSFEPGEEQEEPESPFNVGPDGVETPYYLIRLNGAGQIERLYDKQFGREVLRAGERANVLQMFEDKPLGNDAWDIDLFYQQKMREITGLKSMNVTENGPVRLVIALEWTYGQSVIWQNMVLYSGSRRIDFETRVDYHETHQLLKAAFPVDIRSTYATYDIQYGNVRRPNHWNTSWDQARFESVAHRWADLSERDYGVSLLNDCKYGYDIKDNVLRISLLKAATNPDHLQDIGMHEFTYALYPHGGDFVEGKTVQEAFDLNAPLTVRKGGAARLPESFFTLDNDQVEVDAVKKSEDGDGLVLRIHDYAGACQSVTIRPGFSFGEWAESDLMERPCGPWSAGEEIKLALKPYEIKTVLIKF